MFELYMFTFIDLYNTYMFYVFNSNENVFTITNIYYTSI